MSFDDPLNASRTLRKGGCSCGAHASEAEHEAEILASADARLSRVVKSTVLRALFPQDDSRRAFLRAVGASTALAAISQFFPLGTATEVFAQAAPEKKDLKVGFIPITCATPIIMAHPMGFYTEARSQRGGGQDGGMGGHPRQDAQQGIRRRAHALADAARDYTGRRLEFDPLHHAGGREHQRPGDHALRQAQGQARSQDLEGFQVRGPLRLLHAQLPLALLRRRAWARPRHRHPDPGCAAARDGGQSARRQHRRVSCPRSSEPARRVRRGRLHPCAVEGHLGPAPLLRLRRVQGVRDATSKHLCGLC